jgi:hypothetical protein
MRRSLSFLSAVLALLFAAHAAEAQISPGAGGGGGGAGFLGASAAETNPQVSGDVTTGLFTPGAGLVAVANGGEQTVTWGSSQIGSSGLYPNLRMGNSTATNNPAGNAWSEPPSYAFGSIYYDQNVDTAYSGATTYSNGYYSAFTGPASSISASTFYAQNYREMDVSGSGTNYTPGDFLQTWDQTVFQGTNTWCCWKGIEESISTPGTAAATITAANSFYMHLSLTNPNLTIGSYYGFTTFLNGAGAATFTNYYDVECQDMHSEGAVFTNAPYCLQNLDPNKVIKTVGPFIVSANYAEFLGGIYLATGTSGGTGTGSLRGWHAAYTPTVTTGFSTSTADVVTYNDGSSPIVITVGSTPVNTSATYHISSSGFVTTGWVCPAINDRSNAAIVMKQTNTTLSTTTITVTSYALTTGVATAPTAGDLIDIHCEGI